MLDLPLQQTEHAPKTRLLRLCTREWNEIDRCKRIDRSSVDRHGTPYKITRSSWLRSALAGGSSSVSSVSNVVAPTYDMTWELHAHLLGQRVGKRAACAKKLNHTDHRRSVREMRQSLRHIREFSFILSFFKSEWTRRFSKEDEPERDRSMWKVGEGAQKMRSRNEAAKSEETIARPCVKNEDIQMEIWFYINHQPGPSPHRFARLLFCLPSLPLFLPRFLPLLSFVHLFLLFIESTRIYISLRRLLSPFSSSRFDPCSHDSRRARALRALRRSFEARDRRSYWWQRDSFVLSRRFQLIFIVYLPDQRYLEDNGPPRYIRSEPYHVNTEVYLLSLPTSGRRSRSSHRTRVWFVGDGLRESASLSAVD